VKPFRGDVIRPARPEDAETLARAEYETAAAREGLLASRPGEIPVEAFRDQIRDLAGRGLYVVLEEEGEVVGHLYLVPLGLEATRHVVDLKVVVHPGHTGRGHGRALMEHAIAWARKQPEVEKIELHVRSTNPAAIALYESLGFVHEGRKVRRIKLYDGYADDLCMGLFVDGSAG
jgi:ribosomal protein S18 acetylase RimI-like enzyme